jgi:trigger factor
MQVTVEKLSPVLLELKVEVPAERVRSEVDKAYTALSKTAHIKGFRPGKAPRHVLAHLFGGRVHADVAQRLVDSTLNQALANNNVQPLSQPSIAPAELVPTDAFQYKARFEVRPEIEKVEWEGLAAKRPAVTASDDMIDAEIQRLRREHSTLQSPDPARPAERGDIAQVTFRLEVGGQTMGPDTQEIETEVGSGEVMKEIEEALVGMNEGDTKPVEIEFSERHQNPDLRGKAGTFHLTLKTTKVRVYPEVDDEFAKDCDAENLEDLRGKLKAKIEKELAQKATDTVAEQLVMELCKKNPIPVPPSLVDQQAQLTERELLQTARRQGQRIEPNAELRARVRADAEVKVRAGLLMAEIAKQKALVLTEEDIENGYQELAEQSGKNVAKVKAEYRDPKKQEMLRGMILEDKILDVIEAAATIEQG